MQVRILLFALSLLFSLVPIVDAQLAKDEDDVATRLVQAAAKGDQEGVQEALGQGADVNAMSKGFTAWAAARRAGYVRLAEWLESKGAKTDVAVPSVDEWIDGKLKSVCGDATPGCAVLVAREGQVHFEKAYGQANIKDKIPATTETKFRIGSVTKQFTAAAILKLQEEGKLSVNDPLAKYIPDFPRGDEVTLHHLLTHTSGIVNYTSKPQFMRTVTESVGETDLIDSFQNDPLEFEPGAKYSYCNSGYFLLGHIVGKVAGMSYAEFLDATFFRPLGMHSTGVHSRSLSLENEAMGYSVIDGKTNRAIDWDMSRAGGAGAIYSTLRDLYQWNEALFGGKALSPSSLEAAFRSTTLNDGTKSEYGYGWMMGSQRGLKTIDHSGGLDGFQSFLVRYPDHDLTIVVFVNALASGDLPTPASLANRIGEFILWDKMDPRELQTIDTAVDPKTFHEFVGRYDYGSPVVMDVSLAGKQLYAQLTGQAKFPVFPMNANTFFWKITDAEVEFARDSSGKVNMAIHRQNGHRSENKRLPDEPRIELSAEQLDAFVGRYDYGSGVLTVTRTGEQLSAQLSGQDAFEIHPKAANRFFWKVAVAEIEFVRDENGKVIKGVHTQGGRTFDVPKMEPLNAIELSEDTLDDYVGRYNFGFLAGKMTVTRDGKKLMAQLRGQPNLEIVPVAEDEFRWKDVNASIKFERDQDGKIIRGMHTQGGRSIMVPRVDTK